MPVPRRFDRRPPERDTTRVNERIRVPEVRVIGDDGSQIGIMRTDEALRLAQERDLDLVEVAAEARPPVCRILDYSKYKYEQAQKIKQAKKHQQQIVIREIKFRPKIAQHDYDTKKGHVERFLRHKDKVKITIMFRGREVTHPERGRMILDRLAEELKDLATIEQRPNLDGRNMTMMLGPSKAVLAGTVDEDRAAAAQAKAAAEAEAVADGAAAAAPVVEGEAPAVDADVPAVAETTPPAATEAANGTAPADVEAEVDVEAESEGDAVDPPVEAEPPADGKTSPSASA